MSHCLRVLRLRPRRRRAVWKRPSYLLSDMYAGAAAAAVDTDSDGLISIDEYVDQILHSGGSAPIAAKQYARLDTNKDGIVSVNELAVSLNVPKLSLQDGPLMEAAGELKAGMSFDRPSGTVLDATGQISDPRQVLRYLAHAFPGNLSEV